MKEYIIKSGDTLSKIAQNYKTDVKTLTQLNDIVDPNKIQVGQTISLPGSSYSEAITSAKKQLESGITWGTAWWNVKNAVPDADNMKIDKDLNKTFWAQPGAYEKFAAEKKEPFVPDLELPVDIGKAVTTPSMILPDIKEVKEEPAVEIIELPKKDIKVEVVEPKKPGEVEIIEPEFKEPEVTIVTPEGKPILKPEKRPEDISLMDISRSFFGGITNVFEDKYRKFGDKLDEMFRPENKDVFEEVRDDVAQDVKQFFKPMLETFIPTYKVIDTFLEGKSKLTVGNYFTNKAVNLFEGKESSKPNIVHEIRRMFKESESYNRMKDAIEEVIIHGKPVAGALQITSLYIDQKKFHEQEIQPISEAPGLTDADKKLTQSDKVVFDTLIVYQDVAKELENIGIKITYDENGIPMMDKLGLGIQEAIDEIYKKYNVKPDSFIYKNNQFVAQKYQSLGSLLDLLNTTVSSLEHLDIKSAAPDIYKKITAQIIELAGHVQLIADMSASTRQLNEYNSVYEEATKNEEQITEDMVKLQDEYDALLDSEMIEYLKGIERIDTMDQIEFQIMQNYGHLNKDRLNEMATLAQKFEDAKTRLEINTLQAKNAADRWNELEKTINVASKDFIEITNTKEFKDNLTKYNILQADQADSLIQYMRGYAEADEWIKRNQKAVIDETIKHGDNMILAQAEIGEFEKEVSALKDKVIKASGDFSSAWDERTEVLQYQKIADLAHASAVSQAVEGKRFFFGMFPAISGIFTKDKIKTNKEVMREAFGDSYTWADTQEVYYEYLKNRFGGLLEQFLLKPLGGAYNITAYPAYKAQELITGKDMPKPSEHFITEMVKFYTWLDGSAYPKIAATAVSLSNDLEWVGLPMDTPAGHELRGIGLPDEFKQGIKIAPTGDDPSYSSSRAMRSLLAWLNMPGPEDKQLLWTKFDKREITAHTSGELALFIDPWDEGNEKRIEQIKKLNPHIKDFKNISEGTTILLYKGSETATELMRKQDALYNFLAHRFSEERFITDREINIFEYIPKGEHYADTVSAILDLNNFGMRGIDPKKIPVNEVIRVPKVREMPSLSNLINVKNRLEFKTKCPILFQIREEAFDFVFDPVDILWYPVGKAIKPITKAIGLKAYGKLATKAEKSAFTSSVKGTIDFVYSLGKVIKGSGPLPEHFAMPKLEDLKSFKDLISPQALEAKTAAGKVALTDLLTKLDTKNKRSLATLAALMTKFKGISLSKIFPYEIGKEIATTDKALNRIRVENEILFIEAIQKVSQQTGDSAMKVKSYIHEYMADVTHASPYAESIFWKFNEHMGLSEGRLADMMHKYPDSYYDRVRTTKVSDIKHLVGKEIADDPAMLATIIELNQFESLKIKPDKIPAGMEVIISNSNFFKELEKEIFRGKNITKFEQLYLANNVSELDVVGRQALMDFFQYWDPKKKIGRPIFNQIDLDKRIAYWRKRFAENAPEQKSIDKAIEVANFYRASTEHWASMIEKKYAVPIKMTKDMEIYAITHDKFMKLTPEERSIWNKDDMLLYTNPDTGKLHLLFVQKTESGLMADLTHLTGLEGDLFQVVARVKAIKMENLKRLVIGTMENKWKKEIPVDHEIIESINNTTGNKEYRYLYYPSGKKTKDGRQAASKTIAVFTSLNNKTKGYIVSDVTANNLLHTAYLGKRIGKTGKGWYHTLSKKQQGELSSILNKVFPEQRKKKVTPTYSEKKLWEDKMSDREFNPYDVSQGKSFEYADRYPEVDLVLTLATSLEDLYHSNRHFYERLKAKLNIIKTNVEKGVVRYQMDSIDQLTYFLMNLKEGAPNFFSKKEHQIIELLLRGQDLTSQNILDLMNSNKELGTAWSRSKQAKVLERKAESLGRKEITDEYALKVEFNIKETHNMSPFKTLEEKLKMVPGMISKKEGGLAGKGNIGKFTDEEAAAIFSKYGDATYMFADRRLNREFIHMFSEQVPIDLLPDRFAPLLKEITVDAMQAMAKISKMKGATKASVPMKITEAVTKLQDSRVYLPLETSDVAKRKGGKIVKAKSIKELEAEVAGEIFLPIPQKGIRQIDLDKLNNFEKKAAQAKVDMTFAKGKYELVKKNKRSFITLDKYNKIYKAKLDVYKKYVQDGKDYVAMLGDESIKFIDRAPRGRSIDSGIHEAIEFIISPGLEKTLELVKIPKLASGKKNLMYRHKFILPLDSEPHRLLYEYLRTRDDFIEGVHFGKDVPLLKGRMASEEIMQLLISKDLNPISYLLSKHFVWRDGKTYGLPDDQIIKLVSNAIDPIKFDRNDIKQNIKDLKEVLAKIELQRWDANKGKFIPLQPGDTKISALEVAKSDVDINEMDLMTTIGYTSKQLGQEIVRAHKGSGGKRMTNSDFKTPDDLAADALTSQDLKALAAGDKSVYDRLVDQGLWDVLQEWNAAFYSVKKELGIYDFKPVLPKRGEPIIPGRQLWDLEVPPTGTLINNIERRVLKRTNNNIVHSHLLSSTVRKELSKKKPKYRDIDFNPEKFSDNIGNAFDIKNKMGPEDLAEWIDEKSKLVNYEKEIIPLENKIAKLMSDISKLDPSAENAIKVEYLKYEKIKFATNKLVNKAEQQIKKAIPETAITLQKKFIEPAKYELIKAEKVRDAAIKNIKIETKIKRDKLIENIDDQNNKLSLLKGERDGDQSISRHLLRGDNPQGTLFDKDHGIHAEFIEGTYTNIENNIDKLKKEITDLKKDLKEPGKYSYDPRITGKAIREGDGYIFEDIKGNKRRDVGAEHKLLRLSNAKRELRSLEALKDMIIPWNLAKSNGIKFTAEELYWAGKNIIIDSMIVKLDNLGKLIRKRSDLLKTPDALKSIGIPRVIFPIKFAPSIDVKDMRKVFYDKLPGAKSAKELTLFKTDIIEVSKVGDSKNVVNILQDLLDKTMHEKEFPFIYDMTGKLKFTIKHEQNMVSRMLEYTKDIVLRKEYRDRLKQIDLMLKKLTIIVDPDFLVDNLKHINIGKGMSASITEFQASCKVINKMKERGAVWLFGEYDAAVTPSQLKDSIYSKHITQDSRDHLRIMRESYDRFARSTREPQKGYPHHFARDPESLTTRVLGELDNGKWTPQSLDMSIKAISETAFKDIANTNIQSKIVKYDVGARKVIDYNTEIKNKNALVRSDKATILSEEFKATINNAIANDITFFFPSVMHEGEKSIYNYIKQFKKSKVKFIDARDNNITKIVNDKSIGNVNIDYLLSNQRTSSSKAMQKMYDKWGFENQNRILVSPERMKDNMRMEVNTDLMKYVGDPNKFPPSFITDKASKVPKIAGYPLQSVKNIVVDWKSIQGRQNIKKAWNNIIEDSIQIYRKELLENLEKKYAGKKIPKWHKEMVEKQVESLRIATSLIGDQVFKFDMPMRMWERWYKNISDKLFYYSTLASRTSGLDDDMNFGMNVKYKSYPNRLLMYRTAESIMRWAPILPNTMFAVGRGLKSIWIWSILLLSPGWSAWNSISDGVRAMIGGRSIVTFLHMQRAFIEGYAHLGKKLFKDVISLYGDVKAIDVIAMPNLKTKTGRAVSAQYNINTNKIYFDRNRIQKDFDNKAWTKPKMKGVHAYSEDAFKTIDEWENFIIVHEKLHATMKLEPGELQFSLENRINKEAYKLKNESRFEVFDLTKVAEIKRTEWNPLTSQKFRDVWLAKEKRRMTPAGEVIDIDDWDHITSDGLANVTTDPEKSAKNIKALREDGILHRFLKRKAVIKGDFQIAVSQLEEVRRQIMAFDLIYRRAFTKAEANMKVKKWLYDYRDLTLAGQTFRKFFPFYTFSAKTFQLYFKEIMIFGPGVYNAANDLLDAWEDATYELPDQYKDRIKIGNRFYWLPRFGIQEYFRAIIDPWGSLKEMVDNPLKVAFNFGWGPLSSMMIGKWQRRGFWETGPLMRDFSSTGWYREEIRRYKRRDDMRFYDEISYSNDSNALMTFILTFCPPTQILKTMFEMDVGFTLRGGSLLQSKKVRSLMKFFGLNILKMNDIAYVFDRLNKLPPHLHYFYKKSLENEDPELYNYFRQYQILSRMKNIMDADDGKSKNEKIEELHKVLVIDTYYEKEFQKNGSGDSWLAQNPEFKAIVELHFNDIFVKYGMTSGAVIGKKKFELVQVDASLRKMFEQIKSVDEMRVKKMDLAGIDHPFIGKFDKQELRDALYNSDGSRKFKSLDEAVAILDKYDALIDLLELVDYKAQAEKTYIDWQLLSEAAKEAKREEDAKYYRRMGMLFSIIPDGIEKLSDEQSQVYWDKWRMLKKTLIDSVPEYKKRYEEDIPQWHKEYLEKNEYYMTQWEWLRREERGEDEDYYDEFYSQPAWFQKWYFIKNPTKALYYPIVADYTQQVKTLVKQREDTGVWDSKGFRDALDYLWNKQNALKAWDKSKPGIYNYIDKARQVWSEMAEEDTKDYFDLFYQNEGDKAWDAYREYYLSKPENEYKRITYPFIRTWTNLIERDQKNDTSFSSEWFWSPNNAEARKLYGEHHPLTDGKTKLDYQQQWKDWSPALKEDRGAIYDLVLNSEDWFKKHYFENHPDRKLYYSLASDMQTIDDFTKSLEMFFNAKNKIAREAWERDKPGTIANKEFWRDYTVINNKDGRVAALDFYFDPKNKVQADSHEKNNPGAHKAYNLWCDYAKLESNTWEGRKAKREFLRSNPALKDWWNRGKEITHEEKQVIFKEEIYYTILDRVNAEGKGRQYYLDYFAAKAEAKKYLDDNPDLKAARELRFALLDPVDKTIQKLLEEYSKIALQDEKNQFLKDNKELDTYFFNTVPPGIRKVWLLQRSYFNITDSDSDKQRDKRQSFLGLYPELQDYWEVSKLPTSYFIDKTKFEPYQAQFNKANDYFEAVRNKDWELANKISNKLPAFPPDIRTEEGRWLLSKLYNAAMSTWATTFGSYMSTYYFRSLPSWLRNEYYRRRPESKIISYTPMSRSLNNAVTIENSKHPDLTWARRMMQKYGKNMPISLNKQVQKIMVKWSEWDDRATWSSRQWSEWWAARTARVNGLRQKDLDEIPLLKKELERAQKMFSYSMLPIRGGRTHGVINPFLGASVLLPELTVDVKNDII